MKRLSTPDSRQLPHLSLVIAALAAFAANAAPVYLKAGATGANNGTSWTDAYTDATVACAAAEAGDGVVYAARGVYPVPAPIFVSKAFEIYGGFAGESMGETVAGRDIEANQTVFTGDVAGDDYWAHAVTNSSYACDVTPLPDRLIVGPSGVNMPPAFTEDYDAYIPVLVGGASTHVDGALRFSAKATVDGLTFTGFRTAGNQSTKNFGVVGFKDGAAGSVATNCTFIGNTLDYGCVFTRVDATVANCRMLFNLCFSRNGGVTVHSATMRVRDCLFRSIVRHYGGGGNDGGLIFNKWGGEMDVARCEVSRCLSAVGSKDAGGYGGGGLLFAAENSGNFVRLQDLLVSNCLASSSATANPQVLMNTGRNRVWLERCHFVNNLQLVKPQAGWCYVMLGHSSGEINENKLTAVDCSFEGNRILAPAVAAASGNYVLAIVGNSTANDDTVLVNCSFLDNEARAREVAGVTPILCRGAAVWNRTGAYMQQLGVANCAFMGPDDGSYDIVQYGTGATESLNVVNTVFTSAGESKPPAIYADVPELVRLYSTTIQNHVSEMDGFSHFGGHQYDKIPLEKTVADARTGRFVLVPAAWTPGIRETCDVATNKAVYSLTSTGASFWSWAFRQPGSDEWLALAPLTQPLGGSAYASKLVPDAFGAVRAAGGFARGPSQALTATAENGATLVLRRNIFDAGTFSEEAVQTVATGTAPVPVTVASADAATYAFQGWFDENGDLYSSSATLAIPSLTPPTTVLTARFSAPAVRLTFDLGGCGTFNANGQDTITIEAAMGDAFPDIPPFTPGNYLFVGVDTPPYVPAADATYTLRFITKDVRRLHVVPVGEVPAGSDRSGDSWENATDDLDAAYADAARYRGEVWLKGGKYVRADVIGLRSNVAVIGGFAGTETSADEADPVAHPTILSGDTASDDYWKPNGADPGAANRVAVWNGASFNRPNPLGADDYWIAEGIAKDTTYGFLGSTESPATNVVFSGLTFACFYYSAICTQANVEDEIAVVDCSFLACGTGCDQTRGVCVTARNCLLTAANCHFEGNNGAGIFIVNTEGSRGTHAITGCTFLRNYSASFASGVNVETSANVLVEDCVFAENCVRDQSWRNSVLRFSTAGAMAVRNCRFERNRIRTTAHAVVCIAGGGGALTLEKCRFLGNDVLLEGANSSSAAISMYGNATVLVRDSYFSGNSETIAAGNYANIASSASYGAVYASQSGPAVFLNCTFEGNAVTNNCTASAASVASIFDVASASGFALVNCAVSGSRFGGTAANGRTAEFSVHHANATASTTLAIVNTVVSSDLGAAYAPFDAASPNVTLSLSDSDIANLDVASLRTGNNGFLYDVTSAGAPLKALEERDGVLARGIYADSPFAKAGRPVWRAPNGSFYIHDTVANPAKPWRLLTAKANYSATVTGLALDSPVEPDAFGRARNAAKVAYGPLNVPAPVTVLSVR